jgi:hypothetical protein
MPGVEPVNRKLILIAAALGLVSLAGGFATGWLTRPPAALGETGPTDGAGAGQPSSPTQGIPAPLMPSPLTTAPDPTGTRALTEQQLKELIYQVRERIQEYDRKLLELEKEKERLQTAQQTLKKDIETLDRLRMDLAVSAAGLKGERDALLKTRIEIEQVEKTNLMAIAAAYDRMDAARAGEIFKSMVQGPTANGTTQTANADDAVKILRFMQERTKAKVLAEMAAADPALAADLSQRLKQVIERR